MAFESCVVLDGDKTPSPTRCASKRFESCVVLDGDKTSSLHITATNVFESCVVLDGDKTPPPPPRHTRLRVVLF